MGTEPFDGMSDGMRALLVQGAPLYLRTLIALRHFNAGVYGICEATFNRNARSLGDSIGVVDLDQKKIRPHLFPAMDPDSRDWNGTEVYIGAKVQLAQYAPLILYFYIGIDENNKPAWWAGVSLGFSALVRRSSILKQLQKNKDSLAEECDDFYGTDSYLLDFSNKKSLGEIDTFPNTLQEVVDCWLENCAAVGGIKLII